MFIRLSEGQKLEISDDFRIERLNLESVFSWDPLKLADVVREDWWPKNWLYPGSNLPEIYTSPANIEKTASVEIFKHPTKKCEEGIVTLVETAVWNKKFREKVRRIGTLHNNTNMFFLFGKTQAILEKLDDEITNYGQGKHSFIINNL